MQRSTIMSELKTLAASVREELGKNENRRTRKAGMIPCVFYGSGNEPLSLKVDEAALQKIYKSVGRTTVFNLEIDNNGKKSTHPSLVWQVQRHPVTGRFSHIDFYGVDLEKEVRIRVPLIFSGTAKGTKVGGKLEIFRERVDVMAKPLQLPSSIAVDLTELGIGENLTVGDLQPGEGVTVMAPANQIIVSVFIKGAEAAE